MTEPAQPIAETKPTVPPPKPTQLPADTRLQKIKEISEKLGKILKDHGGLESNIPAMGGEYWQLKAELTALRDAPE